MVQFTIFLVFSSLSVGIYGHQRESPTDDLASVLFPRNFNDDSSTEQYLLINSEATDSSTGATWFASSTENPVTLDPPQNWRPREFTYPTRYALKRIANNDSMSKFIFDTFNCPWPLRFFIDGAFFTIDRLRTDASVDHEMELLAEDLNEMFKPEQSSSADDIMHDPVAEAVMNVNTDGMLDRSGLLAQMSQEVSSQTEHSPIITADALIDIASEEWSNNLESDYEAPIVTTSDTLGEVPEEDGAENPEDISDGTKYFKDWFRMRFPPIKTKTVIYTKTYDSAGKPYDIPVSQVFEPKLAKTSEQVEYKAAVASQAVEGAMGLAETIARETAHFVNRITMEALRQNVDKTKFKTVNSAYTVADPVVKQDRESLL